MSTVVNVDSFIRAESNRMFASLQADTGGFNKWSHNRHPASLDHQPIIRLNRDTLYSASVVDATDGLLVSVHDAGHRYLSVMVINQNHFIPMVIRQPGDHSLSPDRLGTPNVVIGVRILVDPADAGDVAVVNDFEDRLSLSAA